MGFIQRRNGRYRARYRDPLGQQRSETFTRKADAERFLREIQVEIERGRWIDPRAEQELGGRTQGRRHTRGELGAHLMRAVPSPA